MNSKEDVYEKIIAQVLNFLAYQSRSQKEVLGKIERSLAKIKSLTDEDKAQVKEQLLNYLTELKLVNDEAFAKTYLQQKTASPKPVSKKAVSQFLFRKGISKDIIDAVLMDYTNDDEYTAVTKLVGKKIKTLKSPNSQTAKQKLTSYLLTRGFSFDVIRRVVDTQFKVQ